MPTTLVVVRHGKPRRASKKLSRKGRERFSATAHALWRMDHRFERLVYSPTPPSKASAALLRPLLDGSMVVSALLDLAPDTALLEALRGTKVALVGNQPHLSELVAWLVTARRTRADEFPIGHGGVAILRGRLEPGRMQLRALFPAGALRRLD